MREVQVRKGEGEQVLGGGADKVPYHTNLEYLLRVQSKRSKLWYKACHKGMAVCNRFTISVFVERLTTAIFAVVSVLF